MRCAVGGCGGNAPRNINWELGEGVIPPKARSFLLNLMSILAKNVTFNDEIYDLKPICYPLKNIKLYLYIHFSYNEL